MSRTQAFILAAPMAEQEYQPGSIEDFDRLYRSSYNRVVFTLYGVLGDREAAEDCAHDAFVRAFKAWKKWKPDAPAEAWLHRVAINVAYTYARRRRLGEVGQLLRRFGRPAPAGDPQEMAEASALFGALRRLPPEQAAVIILRHHHGYSNREIAFALRAPESTIASRLAKAKKRLREELDWSEGPGDVVTRSDRTVVVQDGSQG